MCKRSDCWSLSYRLFILLAYTLILYKFQYMSAKNKLYLTTFGGHLKFAKAKIKCISKFYRTCKNFTSNVVAMWNLWSCVCKIARNNHLLHHVCLSIHLRLTTQFPLDRFSLNFIFEYYSKTCQENSNFTKIWQE